MLLVPEVGRNIGEVPHDAIVSAEQAESALGINQATEFDEDVLELIDIDQRYEEEALVGRLVNPNGVDYACLAYSPMEDGEVDTFGWHPPLQPRRLTRADFTFTKASIEQGLRQGIADLYTNFDKELMSADAAAVLERLGATLDPTQRTAYAAIEEWAEERLKWKSGLRGDGQPLAAAPQLRLLLRGTAGTGKTHTA